jgi:hypothetical protein
MGQVFQGCATTTVWRSSLAQEWANGQVRFIIGPIRKMPGPHTQMKKADEVFRFGKRCFTRSGAG